ncbi:GNAT family N-acetyltransferase [Paragemmobacter ruber]|uniref:GNAT family N-acetyltransferase n=1 Tax=Paragemmobacter ruber TaxID=1985673 RepID=A0ABW9Y5X8_9RHOB|nr:GNAT family N-acetyltransferase [Rhodobacter ruber]NBE07966.1 GNAT family N-acetyltransferase [Rhodobacter ruber]
MSQPEIYSFPRVTRADYPLLRGWLAQPHVRAWWGDPDEEIALIEEDIDTGPTDMRLVALGGHPFAYVQDYPAHHWPMPHYADFPQGTRAVDTFLGDPAWLGRGHAPRYLRQRAVALLAAGATAVVIDPSPDNERAVRAYRRAGFVPRGIAPCEDGDPVVVMEYDPASSSW